MCVLKEQLLSSNVAHTLKGTYWKGVSNGMELSLATIIGRTGYSEYLKQLLSLTSILFLYLDYLPTLTV